MIVYWGEGRMGKVSFIKKSYPNWRGRATLTKNSHRENYREELSKKNIQNYQTYFTLLNR